MSELRQFPANADAEKCVLGSIAASPREVFAMYAQAGLRSEWFHVPAHATIYEAVAGLLLSGKPLDFITLAEALKSQDRLEAVGGVQIVSDILMFPTAANAMHYLEIVQQKFLLREVIRIGTHFATSAYEHGAEPAGLLESLHGQVTAMISRKSNRPTAAQVIAEIIEEVRSGKNDTGLMPVNVDGIKDRLKLYRGDLLIVSAPTSCGKSALASQLAFDQAHQGKRIALYPLEMAQKQMFKRAIAQLGGNNADFVRKVIQNAGIDVQKIERAKPMLSDFVMTANQILKFDPHMRDDLFSLESILADIRAEHAKKPLSFVVIDYLQLISCSGKYERKQLQIAHITQSLKRLAAELELVVCIPSQQNKAGGTREAEDAENDASALIKIHPLTDEKGGAMDDVKPGRVTVWKQREGQRHIDLPLTFNGLLTRFEAKPALNPNPTDR